MAPTMTLQPARWNEGSWHLADEALAATLCGRTPPPDAETDPEAEIDCGTCAKAADRTGTTPAATDGDGIELFGDVPSYGTDLFTESAHEEPEDHEHGALIGYVVTQVDDGEHEIVGLAGPEVDYAQVHRFSRTFRSATTGSKVWRVHDCGHRA